MSVEVNFSARKLDEALMKSVRSATRKEHCLKAENTRREIRRHRILPNQHIVTVLRDAYERGASQADVEAYFREGLAMVGHWYKAERVALPLSEAHKLEEHAEGVKEDRETDFIHDPSPRNAFLYLESFDSYDTKSQALREKARAVVHPQSQGGLSA